MHGLFWKISGNGGVRGIQFMIAIILARLLSPTEYGFVSIIVIFITIVNVMVQNGFSTVLIQKRHSDDVNSSSILYLSLAIATAMYVVLHTAASSIAGFYRSGVLALIVRVPSVALSPGAVISVRTAYVPREIEFKGLLKATMAAVLVSGTVSITVASRGLGVRIMVGQQISHCLALMTVLFVAVSWKPDLTFAIGWVRATFAFGWKLLLAAPLDTLSNNLHGLIIEKIYNKELLGAYNRGDQFPKLIVNNLGAAIQVVLFPALSFRQGGTTRVRSVVHRVIRTNPPLVLPVLLGLFAVADTMVLALLGEKQVTYMPYLQTVCIAYSSWPTHITNLQAINVVGHNNIFLKLEVIKKPIDIMRFVTRATCSPMTLASIKAGIDFLCTSINTWPNKKLLGYSVFSQWMGIIPSMVFSAVTCIFVYFLQFVLPSDP